jgi:crotonobetainyl-CoA:carnitine CoA-transferase CaiB-like acyl-CoA transferase
MTLALEGIKVLDLSRYAPGFVCTMLLGDLGADVLCVEAKIKDYSLVDDTVTKPRSSLFRNKKSIGLDLKSKAGKEIFLKLACEYDVIVEGSRPGAMQKLGIDYETVRKLNPRIIYCSITGYGQDGPYKDLPGHDPNYLALTGVMDATGEKGGRPAMPLNLIGDMAGGSFSAVTGIMAALIARERTGRGQFVDIAMMDGILALFSSVAYMYLEDGLLLKRGEHWLTGGAAWSNVYMTLDHKYISVVCAEPWFWDKFCKAMGQEELIPYQFKDDKQEESFNKLQKKFLTDTRNNWFNKLKKEGIPAAPVYSLDEVFSDPQVLHRQMVIQVDDPVKGKLNQIGIGIKLSETPGKVRSGAPQFARDTREILKGLGYNNTEIEAMSGEQSIYLA